MRSVFRDLGRCTGLAGALVLLLLPLGWTLLAALGLKPVERGWAGALTLQNFAGIMQFEPAFGQEFAYTLAVAGGATALTLLVGFPAAHWLARTRWPGVAGLMQVLLALAVFPALAYGLPLAALWRGLGLYGSFGGLVLAYAGAQAPLALWILRGFLLQIPPALEEAARLDGAGWPTVLGRVVLPVAAGGVAATGVLVFVLDWNLFLVPALLSERAPLVLPMAMRDFFEFERDLDWPTAASVLLLSLAPALLLVFAAERALERLILVPQEGTG